MCYKTRSSGGNKRVETILYIIYFLSSFSRLRKERKKEGRGESLFRENYKSEMNITRNFNNVNDSECVIFCLSSCELFNVCIFEKEELIKDKHHYRYRVANFKLT